MSSYQVIATLGPASNTDAVWMSMLEAGATAFRLNTSHLDLGQLWIWLERLDSFLRARYHPRRLSWICRAASGGSGQFAPQELVDGQTIELVLALSSDHPNRLPVPHADFFQVAGLPSPELRLNDARVHLRVEQPSANSSAPG